MKIVNRDGTCGYLRSKRYGSDLPHFVEPFIGNMDEAVNRFLQDDDADDGDVRQQEANLEQIVRVDAQQNESRRSDGIERETFSMQHLADNHERNHERRPQY